MKKELAARVDIPNANKDKAKNKTRYQGHCEHCRFYGHELKDCYGKKKGLPAATPEEKIQRKLYCKICRKPGKHDTEDHKDEELAGMDRIKKQTTLLTLFSDCIMYFTQYIYSYFTTPTPSQQEFTCPALDINSKHHLDNWLIDSGASAHMSPYKEDLNNLKHCNITVSLADGSEVKCNRTGTCKIKIVDDDKVKRILRLDRVVYVPGLNCRLFSVDTFR